MYLSVSKTKKVKANVQSAIINPSQNKLGGGDQDPNTKQIYVVLTVHYSANVTIKRYSLVIGVFYMKRNPIIAPRTVDMNNVLGIKLFSIVNMRSHYKEIWVELFPGKQ